MIRRVLCLCVLFSIVLATNLPISEDSPAWNETWTDTLKKHLLTNYDRFVRPAQHYNTTTVYVSLFLLSVDVDDMKNVVTAKGWFIRIWTDDKLKWNSTEYGGLTTLHLGSHEIWSPDVHLLNSANSHKQHYDDVPCLLYDNGEVIWSVPTTFHSYCRFNFQFWPFEINTCQLNLASWTYDGNQANLTLASDHGFVIDADRFVAMSEWVIRNLTANRREVVYKCCPEPYITVEYGFELHRSSEIYYHIIFVPIVPIVILILITFWLQPHSEIKIIINASSIFIVVLYLIYFAFKVPPRIDSVPIIVKFYSACLVQATVSLIISIFVINITKFASILTIPRYLRRFLMGTSWKYLGLGHTIQEIRQLQRSAIEQEGIENHQTSISISTTLEDLHCSQQKAQSPQASNQNTAYLEWILLATAINRLSFLLFCFIFIVTVIKYVDIKQLPTQNVTSPHV